MSQGAGVVSACFLVGGVAVVVATAAGVDKGHCMGRGKIWDACYGWETTVWSKRNLLMSFYHTSKMVLLVSDQEEGDQHVWDVYWGNMRGEL